MEYQCGHCGIIEESMQRCSSCHVVYYCSRHCQKKDWKEKHRMVCNRMKYGYDPEEEVTSESSDSSINAVYSSDSCATCGGQGILRKCAQCLSIQYCSKSCQRKHWPRHKGHCQQNQEVVEVIKTDGYKKQLREAKTERLQTRRLQEVLRYGYVPSETEHPLDRRFGSSSRKTSHMFDFFENKSTSNSARKQAKLFVERKFPMQQIVDEVDGIPEPYGFFPSHGNSRVSFLGFITRYDSYRERHRVFVQDVRGEEICVGFHLEHDCPYPYFTSGDVRPGKYLCLSDPRLCSPLWGPSELRVDDPSDVFLFEVDG